MFNFLKSEETKEVQLFRASGKPIDKKHLNVHEKSMDRKMNKLEKKHGKCDAKNAHLFQSSLINEEQKLLQRYPNNIMIAYPTNLKELEKITKKYGAICFTFEEGKSIAYIMDK